MQFHASGVLLPYPRRRLVIQTLLAMKLSVLIVLVTALQVSARGYTQQISLSEKNASLEKIFRSIEKQTSYVFFFDYKLMDKSNKVTISVRNAPLENVLAACFKNQPLSYSIVGRNIVVGEKDTLPRAAAQLLPEAAPPPVEIKGRVVNESGAPLHGASVMIKESKRGTQTGADGYFTISAQPDDILVFSYVGYAARELPVQGHQGSWQVALTPLNEKPEEIVVIGYGTARKKDLTGAVAQIKSNDISAYPTTNMMQAMQGRATGVQVLQNNGSPGSSISVRIRGTNSIMGSNEPLYVVDGFPFSGSPTFLQNADIESIEVLKDASSIAIYGSRGANGVVMITTKAGRKNQRTTVDVDAGYTVQGVSKKMKLLTPGQYAKLYNEQAANDNLAPYFTQQQVDSLDKTTGTDWQDLVLHRAPMFVTNVTVSGGSEKTRFSVSSGIFRQDGIIRNSNYNRYSLRANVTHDISKVFSLSYNATLTRINSDRKQDDRGNRGSDLFSGMLMAPPTLSPYLPDGSYRRLTTAYPFISNALVNPLVLVNKVADKIKGDRVLANAALTIKPTKDLSIRISAGVQNVNDRNDKYSSIEPSTSSVGSAFVRTDQLTDFLNENVVNYNKTIGKHNIGAMAGFTYQNDVATSLTGSGTGFLSDQTGTGDLGSAATPGIPASSYVKWSLLSYIGRVNYSFDDRYLFTVSMRRDGSSRYSANNRWSNFPSAAIAWRLYNESFIRHTPFLSDLKIRASYGATGSTAISPYQTLNLLYSSNTIFGDALYTALSPGTTLPGNLKWETTNQLDAGVDAAFFNNTVHVTADVYLKKTKNLLNNVQLPTSMGYTLTVQNVGEIQNKGLELGIDASLFQHRAVRWNVSGNISMNRNKVLKLYNGQDIYGNALYTGSLNDYVSILREGQPFGMFYGYKETGYTADGNLKYEDRNGDGAITNADKTFIGNPNPKFIYGLNSVLSWKGFEFTVFIQGSQGNDIFNLNKSASLDLGMGLNLPQEVYTDHWTKDNPNAKYPKITRALNGNMSSRFVEDGSYLRFKTIQLAYNLQLPASVGKWFKGAQVYLSGQNLITITKYSWYDPEINAYGGSNSVMQGIDYYTYPTSKSVTLGIRCHF
jgi:TonB-linked SusC/RagA family outer membrane protein